MIPINTAVSPAATRYTGRRREHSIVAVGCVYFRIRLGHFPGDFVHRAISLIMTRWPESLLLLFLFFPLFL